MKPLSVLIISYHFYPSNEIGARRATALAKFLVAKGARVFVVSAFGNQPIEYGSQLLPGIVAIPVRNSSRRFTDAIVFLKRKIVQRHPAIAGDATTELTNGAAPGTSVWGRIRKGYFRVVYFIDDYKRWGIRALRAALRESKRHPPDLIFSSAPPPTVSCAATLAGKLIGVPHIADLRDPWSDTLSTLHPGHVIELRLVRAIERWVMHSAAAITSTGSKVVELLTGRQPELASKTFIVRNGYDTPVAPLSPDTGGRLAILFAGELYLNRDPFPLLNAIERLLGRPHIDASRISVTFMGRKTAFAGQSFEAWLAGKRCASAVSFLPPQPPAVVAEASRQSTVLLNLAQNQPLSVPAKTYEHLASGRENLLLCEDDAESAQIVAQIPGVTQVDPRNATELDRVLLDLYERHVNQRKLMAPRECDVEVFSRAYANATFWHIIESTTSRSPGNSLQESPS